MRPRNAQRIGIRANHDWNVLPVLTDELTEGDVTIVHRAIGALHAGPAEH